MPARALQGKCEVHKGLLLHVDAPVKQFILDLNTKHCHHIVINSLPNDDRKIFVSREFEDASGHEQDTLAFLQVCVRRVGAERRGACVARPPQHADTGRCSVAAGPARPPSGKHYIQPGRRAMKVQRSYRRMRCTASCSPSSSPWPPSASRRCRDSTSSALHGLCTASGADPLSVSALGTSQGTSQHTLPRWGCLRCCPRAGPNFPARPRCARRGGGALGGQAQRESSGFPSLWLA